MTTEISTPGTQAAFELIADYACETGEGPLWHPMEQKLYWTDIPRGRLFRYDPATGGHEQCYQGRPVGGFTVQKDGSLLLFLDHGTVAIWRGGEEIEVIAEVAEERDTRFNDVVADPRGRVFCGTMATEQRKGCLYRLDTDRSIHLVLDGIACSNGMAFSRDDKSFYYTDSFASATYLFDYNVEDGSISNQRVFARFSEADGWPDGATLDAEGRLWSAFWDGGCIARLDQNGGFEKKLALPVPKVSSLTFGGPLYEDIYVTTAGGNVKQLDGPLAGALFRLKGCGKGIAENLSRIQVP